MTVTDVQIERSDQEFAGAAGVDGDRVDSSGDALSTEAWAHAQRLEGMRRSIAPLALADMMAGLLAAALLWSTLQPELLLGWLVLHLGVGGARWFAARRFDADKRKPEHARSWAIGFAVLSAAAGLSGSFPVGAMFEGQEGLRFVGEVYLIAMPAIALVALRFFASASIAFSGCMLVPVALYLLFVSDVSLAGQVGLFCGAYAVVVAVASIRGQAAAVASLVARFQRERFVQELQRMRHLASAAAHAKSEFLARVSHELRTPLTIVLGMAQLLKSSHLDGEQREGVDMIERSGETLLALIGQLLDLSEVEAGRLSLESGTFDLRRMIDVIARQVGGEATLKGLEFSVVVADSVPVRVRGDERRLRQVLRNLCDNAVKFTASGRVGLDVDVVSVDERPVSPGWVTIRFSVSDTGIGMDKEVAAQVFEPFFQAENALVRRFGGSGLGLAVARELVRLMGGEIHLQSQPGHGTTFLFTANFERIAGTDEGVARALAEDISSQARLPIQVLLVEDEPVNVALASALLRLLVEYTDVAESGEEALRAVQRKHYDVVLMDCVMPGMDGYETARKIRDIEKRLGRRSRIIALTASTMPEDRDRCFAAGMDAFVSKPYRLAEMRGVLRQGMPGGV